jgi:hypothetical protein
MASGIVVSVSMTGSASATLAVVPGGIACTTAADVGKTGFYAVRPLTAAFSESRWPVW